MLFQTYCEYLYTDICCWCCWTLLEQKCLCCCFHLGRCFSKVFAVNSQFFACISAWSFVDRFRRKEHIRWFWYKYVGWFGCTDCWLTGNNGGVFSPWSFPYLRRSLSFNINLGCQLLVLSCPLNWCSSQIHLWGALLWVINSYCPGLRASFASSLYPRGQARLLSVIVTHAFS